MVMVMTVTARAVFLVMPVVLLVPGPVVASIPIRSVPVRPVRPVVLVRRHIIVVWTVVIDIRRRVIVPVSGTVLIAPVVIAVVVSVKRAAEFARLGRTRCGGD
jgi:hypothetical protein